jgi:hypothetical protein
VGWEAPDSNPRLLPYSTVRYHRATLLPTRAWPVYRRGTYAARWETLRRWWTSPAGPGWSSLAPAGTGCPNRNTANVNHENQVFQTYKWNTSYLSRKRIRTKIYQKNTFLFFIDGTQQTNCTPVKSLNPVTPVILMHRRIKRTVRRDGRKVGNRIIRSVLRIISLLACLYLILKRHYKEKSIK